LPVCWHDLRIIQILILIFIPQTIEVRVTGLGICEPNMKYKTETVDLKEYVKGVLPNEWIRTWHSESLKAGAVVVKSYAVSMYLGQGFVWDCNWNQVYNPDKRTPETDKAVDDTWNVWLWNDGITRAYYDDYRSVCAARGHECMSQFGSLEDAETMLFDEILLKYYDAEIMRLLDDRRIWYYSLLVPY